MGEIHELFVWALALVWFAGATPDFGEERKGLYSRFSSCTIHSMIGRKDNAIALPVLLARPLSATRSHGTMVR